jgi:hypothetical protein
MIDRSLIRDLSLAQGSTNINIFSIERQKYKINIKIKKFLLQFQVIPVIHFLDVCSREILGNSNGVYILLVGRLYLSV